MLPFLSPSRRAFTLIEILVVLAIVLLLAAMLFPLFTKARNSARSATCASNLKQVGLALRLYLNDSRNVYPNIFSTDKAICSWTHGLASYVKQTSIFNCPANTDQFYVDECPPDKRENDVTRYYDGGYILNKPNGSNSAIFNDHDIHRPSQMILVLDGVSPLGTTRPMPGTGPLSMQDISPAFMYVDLRHDDAVNALFADGHVKRQSSSQLLDRSKWTLSGTDVQPTPLPRPTFPPLPPH